MKLTSPSRKRTVKQISILQTRRAAELERNFLSVLSAKIDNNINNNIKCANKNHIIKQDC